MRMVWTLAAVVTASTVGLGPANAGPAESPPVEGGGAPLVGAACGRSEPARLQPGATGRTPRATTVGYAPPDEFKLIYACPAGPRGEQIPDLALTGLW
jgi:hypothetical protein